MVVVGFVAPAEPIVTVPVQEPGVVSVVVLTETVTGIGVVPLVEADCVGETTSQFPQLVVVPVTRNVSDVPAGLETPTI
jgi:hypothetical protein